MFDNPHSFTKSITDPCDILYIRIPKWDKKETNDLTDHFISSLAKSNTPCVSIISSI